MACDRTKERGFSPLSFHLMSIPLTVAGYNFQPLFVGIFLAVR
jgi:hypothetical protein